MTRTLKFSHSTAAISVRRLGRGTLRRGYVLPMLRTHVRFYEPLFFRLVCPRSSALERLLARRLTTLGPRNATATRASPSGRQTYAHRFTMIHKSRSLRHAARTALSTGVVDIQISSIKMLGS